MMVEKKITGVDLDGEDMEELDIVLPANIELLMKKNNKNNNNGIMYGEGIKVKVSTKKSVAERMRKLEEARLSKSVVERRSWAKFGITRHNNILLNITNWLTERVFLEPPGSKQEEEMRTEGMVCWTCRKICDHWTVQCPYKDLTPQPKGLVDKPKASRIHIGKGYVLICRNCGEKNDHWTPTCPYKDLAPQPKGFVDNPPTTDGAAPGGSTEC